MAKAIIAASGGGGAGSDECTAAAGDVLKGKAYVGSDTNDEVGTGTLELTANATTDQVLSGRTYYNDDAKAKRTGSMPNVGTEQAKKVVTGSNRVYYGITKGAHLTEGGSGYPEVYAPYSTVASTVGLTAAKLATGQTVLGITGTYKGLGNAVAADVRSGKKFSTGSLSNATGTMATQGGSTTTPGTANKTIVTATKCVTGNIVVAGASTLVAGNIKKNVTIFGVKGTFEGWVPTATDLYLNGSFYNSCTGASTNSGVELGTNAIIFDKTSSSSQSTRVYGSTLRPAINVTGYNYINVTLSIPQFIGTNGASTDFYLGLVSSQSTTNPEPSSYLYYTSYHVTGTGSTTLRLNVSNYNSTVNINLGPRYQYNTVYTFHVTRIWLS